MKKARWKVELLVGVFLLSSLGSLGAVGAQKKVLRCTGEIPNIIIPGKMTSGGEARVAGALYDWLVRCIPGTLKIRPELATSWEASPDAKVWTVHLREGVKFHDGTDFTAEDVIFTVKRTQDPEVGHTLKKAFEIVEKIEEVDKYTVRLYLKNPNAKFIHLFTDYNAAILSSTYNYEKYGITDPMGTGPFTLKKIHPRESCILVKNPNYWMEGRPRVDEIHWTWTADPTTAMNMLETGAVDVFINPTSIHTARIARLPNCKLYLKKVGAERFIYMRSDQPPFRDNRVRLALKYCIDQEKLLKATFGPLYEEVKDIVDVREHPINPAYPEYTEIPPRKRNIEKAKELLAEAGYPDGFDAELYYATDMPGISELALALQEMLLPAGLRIELVGTPRNIYLSKYWLKVNFGITIWGVRVDPVALFNMAYKTGAPWNESHFSNQKLDNLIDAIAAEADFDKRKKLYAELEKLFYEEGSVICVGAPAFCGLNKTVKDYKDAVTFYGDWRDVTIEEGE